MDLTLIILAGGKGERLKPLTDFVAKPAVSFADMRIIDISLSHAIKTTPKEIFIITQYLSDTIENYIYAHYPVDPRQEYHFSILSPQQDASGEFLIYEGTADAIRKNLDHLLRSNTRYVMILSGDQLFNMDLFQVIDLAEKLDTDLAICCHPVDRSDAPRLGILKVNKNHYITEFVEKPKDPKILDQLASLEGDRPFLASMGLYLFKREALIKLLSEDLGKDFGKDLIPKMIAKGDVAGFIYDDYWEDIGTVRSYFDACLLLASGKSGLKFDDPNHPFMVPPHFTSPAQFNSNTLELSMVCQGARIGTNTSLKKTLCGPKTLIGKNCKIENCLIIGHQPSSLTKYDTFTTKIHDNCILKNVIVDAETILHEGVCLVNEKNLKSYEDAYILLVDDIIVIKRFSNIPKNYTF
ncbi:MAG: sugar phosphate nucleotidyltransferase [Chlamydiia bacterium]